MYKGAARSRQKRLDNDSKQRMREMARHVDHVEAQKRYGIRSLETSAIYGDPRRAFNRMYRDRRLAAKARGESFPLYNQAKARLEAAVRNAYEEKSPVNPADFWAFVWGVDKR